MTNSNLLLPLALEVGSGRIGPLSDTMEISLMPSGDPVKLGENGEEAIAIEEFLSMLDPPNQRFAELEYSNGEGTRILSLEILELRRGTDESLIVTARPAQDTSSETGSNEGFKAQGAAAGAIECLVTAREDGSALPGAVITAVHEPTGTRYSVSTRENGRAVIFGVRTGGPYTVTAMLDGFKPLTIPRGTVSLGGVLQRNFALVLASAEEVIGQATLRVNR